MVDSVQEPELGCRRAEYVVAAHRQIDLEVCGKERRFPSERPQVQIVHAGHPRDRPERPANFFGVEMSGSTSINT